MSIRSLRVAGLFAGIGGIESGLEAAGHRTTILCENDAAATAVLEQHFPEAPITGDIRELKDLPEVDLVAAGFPCQDLSLAGTQAGIMGKKSGLVDHMFRLIQKAPPEMVVMENVLYLIRRDRGAQLRIVTDRLEALGYRWAYRVVDSRGFGLPQRRKRVVIVASQGDIEPVDVLFSTSVPEGTDDTIERSLERHTHYGFYWTEGKRAIGWAPDSVPPIKGGSGLGIPSAPAVMDLETRTVGTPTILDGERLQGFPPGWTDVEHSGRRLKDGKRWHLVGNAVSVPVSYWIGSELAAPQEGCSPQPIGELRVGRPMPKAVAGAMGKAMVYDVSSHVLDEVNSPIGEFLSDDLKPLSERALAGFLGRLESGIMNMPGEFIEILEERLMEARFSTTA